MTEYRHFAYCRTCDRVLADVGTVDELNRWCDEHTHEHTVELHSFPLGVP